HHAANLYHEHDRILHHGAGIEFDHGVAQRPPDDFCVPQTLTLFFCHVLPRKGLPQKVFPAIISRCSSTGPRLRAGKNVSAPTITITDTRRTVNRGVVTGNVPAVAGTAFFFARLPAIASMGMIMKNRPTSMVIAPAVLYQRVLPFMPPNAEPLFPADDVN